MTTALVIGAGPAGLMAAEQISAAGIDVMIAEAKPSAARKFLMAGKSGLNLTKDEPFEQFLAQYEEAADVLQPMLRSFGPQETIRWAEGLGQELFTGSTGRVFPKVMKASPLLRSWLERLAGQGVELKTRWRWVSGKGKFEFETPSGPKTVNPKVCVLACGGVSWARLGADGAWAKIVEQPLAPFQPSNVGFAVKWSPHMAKHFGTPVKNAALIAGGQNVRGEFVVSERGLEGGGIYTISRRVREGALLSLDLMPDQSEKEIRDRLGRKRGKASLGNFLRKTLKLPPVKLALLMEFAPKPLPADLAPLIKNLSIRIDGLRPMDEAISTAGGIPFSALNEDLMLKSQPGVFAAGEMLDWEAPTGGYLLTACLATGRWAGQAAVKYVSANAKA